MPPASTPAPSAANPATIGIAGRLMTDSPKMMPEKAMAASMKPEKSMGRGVRVSILGR